MERFKTIDVGVINQKENNPSLTRDGKDRNAQDGNAILNYVPQAGVTKSQQPLKDRNMAAQPQIQKPHDQVQLLEKFRKLRQWQQQQQESMFRQQQQQMETLKMEQNKLQSILAAQKRLQEQQTTSSVTVRSPNLVKTSSQADTMSPTTAQSHPQQKAGAQMPINMMTRAEAENNEPIGHHSNVLLRSIPTSSAPPIVMSQGDSDFQMRQFGSQQYNGTTEKLEGSLASFNKTVYPMMWNSSNYRLPLGTIPLSSAPKVVPLQGQPVSGSANSNRLMPYAGMNYNGMIEVPSSSQIPVSSQELRGVGYNPGRDSQSHFEVNARETNTALECNKSPGMKQELERLWSHHAEVKGLADADSQIDEQSEADAMSGVYPLYDSEPEVGVNESDEENEEKEMDEESEAEEELEETSERNATVIELEPHPEDVHVEGMNEQNLDKSNTEVDDEIPIKPGIGGASSAKTFEELLEQQLRLDEASKADTNTQNASQKPQRTFLRKGQGLARFKGKSASNKTGAQSQESAGQFASVQQRKEKKTGNAVGNSSQGNDKQIVTGGGLVAQTRVTRKVASRSPQVVTAATQANTLRKPQQFQVSNAPKTKVATSEAQTTASKLMIMKPRTEESDPPGLLNSIDASFQMRLRELEEKQELEEEELEEFELLEQAAANASFSSNSSVVVKVLAKARGNVPDSKKVSSGQSVDSRGPGGILSPVDTGYGSGDGKVALSVDDPGYTVMESSMNELQENESEDEGSDITLQEMSLDGALELDEGQDDKRQTTGEQYKVLVPLYLDPSSSLAIEDDFDDEEAWGAIKKQAGTGTEIMKKNMEDDSDSDDDDSDVTISDIFPLVTSTPPAHMKGGRRQWNSEADGSEGDGLVASTPPTSALVTKLFPQMKPKQKVTQPPSKQADNEIPKTQTGKEKKEESVDTIQSMAVREKLKELETEIDKFRTENAALAKMRTEREEGLKKLQTEIAAFEKQKTEELERLEQFREEELRKLRRERRVFEKYQKAARSMPDKKERDEIESLRGQVVELREELKQRESRWSAASTRNRQRIEALEQQNKELQEEVKLLEHYRLQQWREDEQAKQIKEEMDSRPKKPLQRKTAKTTEEESGPRLPLRHRSPPLRPALVEAVPSSTPENATVDPGNRPLVASIDANNNQARTPHQEEDASTDILSKSNEENSQISSMAKSQEDITQEIRKSKRSPRRRSKTPDSSEKLKRNVHFQDEEKNDQSDPRESVSLNERTTRQDPREIMHPDGKVYSKRIYYYSDAQTTHTTYPDGLEVLQFPSKQIEKHYRDGTKEIIFPDQTIKYLYPNGAEECVFSDGTIQKVSVEGERTIEFPNGQRETHTKYYKKREYPDGTVKTVYPDGRTETRYATGRMRVKDRDGRVLVDSSGQNR
ncbi:centromere protein J-like [Orbicella faveolata]|uniref:centromere protein J-like n=1 Tax=Orbicella faveolata TaxID=48498 RepID=UPI0009E33A9D|nr:centromere protein J-like [Orbicella faveolata]